MFVWNALQSIALIPGLQMIERTDAMAKFCVTGDSSTNKTYRRTKDWNQRPSKEGTCHVPPSWQLSLICQKKKKPIARVVCESLSDICLGNLSNSVLSTYAFPFVACNRSRCSKSRTIWPIGFRSDTIQIASTFLSCLCL